MPQACLARIGGLDYCCFMIGDVRQHLQAVPFEPFSIVTTSGHRYRVPSADHAGIHPHGSRLVIWFDDDSSITLSGLHIVGIEKGAASRQDPV